MVIPKLWSYVVFTEVFCSVWIYFFLFPTCKCFLFPDLCLFVLLFFSAKLFFCFSPKRTLTSNSFHSSLYIVRKCLFGFDKILVFLFVCQGFSSCSMCRKRQCLSVNSRSLPTLKGSQTDELYCDKCSISSRGGGEGILPYKGYIKHLMTGPKGNSEFCFPRISIFPETKSRETLRFEGNKIHCYTSQLKYVSWLEGNVSRAIGQNSMTP